MIKIAYIRGDTLLPIFLTIEDSIVRSKLEQIYYEYKKVAYWTAYNILKDHHEAEDVVQDAIVKISSIIDNIEEVKCNKTRALIVIMVRNLSFNIYNRRKKVVHTHYDEIEIISEDFSLDEEIISLEQASWLAEVLGKLKPTYGDILVLKYYYEYSNKEISSLLGITEGNIRIRLHRAKASIKELIEKEGFANETK